MTMDTERSNSDTIENALQIQEIVRNASKLVFFTGAGISKESGIPTFRDKDGLWKKYDPIQLASYSAFISNPKLVWDFFYSRIYLVCQADFNRGHQAISKFQSCNPGKCSILTQNIDRLHQRAGSTDVVELHGNIFGVICESCSFKEQFDHLNFFTKFSENQIPLCPICKSVLKPNVVLFKEPLPGTEWQKALYLAANCDVMVVVGSSLNVSPANSLPYYAMKNHAVLIEVNPNKTKMTHLMDFSLRASASEMLPQLLKKV